VDILVWLKDHGIDSSLGALSEFYAWERTERRMEAARERASQAREELAKDPNATPEDVARVGQIVFTSEMVDAGNVRGFVALEKLRLANRVADQDERRLAILEAKARRLEDAEAKVAAIQGDASLTPEQQRTALMDEMDRFFGLKKTA
jgi:hypothetical protein